jgi:hypothetical protein
MNTGARRGTVACPTCGQAVALEGEARWRPFCSERCKLIDLGDWLDEKRRIPGAPADFPGNGENP